MAVADVGFTLSSMPVRLADILGYYEDEGLDVEFVTFANTTAGLASLQSGSTQFGVTGIQAPIQAAHQGGQLVQVVNVSAVPAISLLVGEKFKDAKSIKDLEDARIGISSLGASTDLLVRKLFERNGLDPSSAKVVPVGLGATGIAALVNDKVDAIVQNDPTTTKLVESGQAKLLYDARTVEGTKEIYGGPLPGNGVSTIRDFLESNPNTVAAFGRAIARTGEYLQTAPIDEIVDKLPANEYYPDGDRELFEKILENSRDMFSGDGTTDAEMPETMVGILAISNPDTDYSKIDLSSVYYNGWASSK